MPLWPITAQSMPGTASSSLRDSAAWPTCTSAITSAAPRARRDATASRAAAAGSRASMPAACHGARSSVAETPKMPIFDSGGVDDAVGVEQPLAVAAEQVRRHDRDAAGLRQPAQQRQPERQISFARGQRRGPHAPVGGGQQAAAALDLARVGRLAVVKAFARGEEQVARVQHQDRVGFAARAVDLRRAPRDAAQRVHRAAARLVFGEQVGRVGDRDLLAARRRRRGRRRRGGGRCSRGRRVRRWLARLSLLPRRQAPAAATPHASRHSSASAPPSRQKLGTEAQPPHGQIRVILSAASDDHGCGTRTERRRARRPRGTRKTRWPRSRLEADGDGDGDGEAEPRSRALAPARARERGAARAAAGWRRCAIRSSASCRRRAATSVCPIRRSGRSAPPCASAAT